MNRQTKIMTAAAIILFANMCAAAFGTSVAYKIISLALAGAAWACSHWFNQDFTEEACETTGELRQRKDEKDPNYIGERFFDEIEEEEDEEEDDE